VLICLPQYEFVHINRDVDFGSTQFQRQRKFEIVLRIVAAASGARGRLQQLRVVEASGSCYLGSIPRSPTRVTNQHIPAMAIPALRAPGKFEEFLEAGPAMLAKAATRRLKPLK